LALFGFAIIARPWLPILSTPGVHPDLARTIFAMSELNVLEARFQALDLGVGQPDRFGQARIQMTFNFDIDRVNDFCHALINTGRPENE
jgi:hypothetical protein